MHVWDGARDAAATVPVRSILVKCLKRARPLKRGEAAQSFGQVSMPIYGCETVQSQGCALRKGLLMRAGFPNWRLSFAVERFIRIGAVDRGRGLAGGKRRGRRGGDPGRGARPPSDTP